MSQQILSDWERQQDQNAHHRAMILKILHRYPEGLTVQQIQAKELDVYGFTFLTDNRLRELRKDGLAVNFGDKPQKWKTKETQP